MVPHAEHAAAQTAAAAGEVGLVGQLGHDPFVAAVAGQPARTVAAIVAHIAGHVALRGRGRGGNGHGRIGVIYAPQLLGRLLGRGRNGQQQGEEEGKEAFLLHGKGLDKADGGARNISLLDSK
ncbi:hypothetical protein HMPREF9136_1556 [Prevotella dentalis DSM 3688]|uniref:Uncharacterized protein n=1 Tax=Prevotella dentalis (strain ATCC 49559 / DSM 3688 / JCM 13448 / NCTC 12043 / ES 2772) TaxID=908937 RepID=F9D3X8_PREDD|nr:hypothetical protein HMPREF9136_1556 [Prevotella dentalis DSM 3688]